MQRLFGAAIVLLWISAMTALFVRDIWPVISAQDVPPITGEELAALDERKHQFAIYQKQSQHGHRRIGTAWHEVNHGPALTSMTSNVLIDGISMIPVARIQSRTDYDDQGQLDSFRLDVYGIPMTRIHIHGERRGIYFPVDLQLGPLNRQTNLKLSGSRMIGESIQPFSVLPDLEIGQSWRMQVLDPMSAILNRDARFTSVVARVTDRQLIDFDGDRIECFVVKTIPEQVTAWVDERGRVLRQSTRMPGLGEVIVEMEAFDQEALDSAMRRVPARSFRDELNGLEGDNATAVREVIEAHD